MTGDQPALPGFTRVVDPNHQYLVLHQRLWPPESTSSLPADLAAPEPERLAQYIETSNADLSFWTEDKVGDVTAMDVDNSEQPPTIRYINLTKHTSLALLRLIDLDTLIVRQEYVDFMAHANAIWGKKINFFLTGQPGIGE